MKSKPIGVRFDEQMVDHFNKTFEIKSHQTMLNYLWTFYAQKAGLHNGSVSLKDLSKNTQTIKALPIILDTNYTIDTTINHEEIKKMIEKIKAEEIPVARDTPNGRKYWQIEQNKKIKDLQQQLQNPTK
jgi:short-subunit dehydrogenase involved in D-alanine esterification of teichoic acids